MKKSIKILTVGILSAGILAACGEEENKIEDKKEEVKVEQNEVEKGKDEVSENVKDENKEGGSELDMPIDYNVLNGEVEKIEEKENGTKYIPIGSPEPNFAIVITESTKIYNAKGEPTEIKEGDKFVAYDKLNKPMITIHQPQHSPEMVVIENEKVKMLKEKVEKGAFREKNTSCPAGGRLRRDRLPG